MAFKIRMRWKSMNDTHLTRDEEVTNEKQNWRLFVPTFETPGKKLFLRKFSYQPKFGRLLKCEPSGKKKKKTYFEYLNKRWTTRWKKEMCFLSPSPFNIFFFAKIKKITSQKFKYIRDIFHQLKNITTKYEIFIWFHIDIS